MLSCNRYHAYHYDGDNDGCHNNQIGNNSCGCNDNYVGNNSCGCDNNQVGGVGDCGCGNTCGCSNNLLGCAADGFVNTAFRILRGLDNSLSGHCGCGCRGNNHCGCR
ncbi:MAG: hypothetical protein E7618_02935 [Ruminococcaceae bacterium]|nr:hypothetical protein [Oscillospiraceae bacterium]